jgi:hypothetical protein
MNNEGKPINGSPEIPNITRKMNKKNNAKGIKPNAGRTKAALTGLPLHKTFSSTRKCFASPDKLFSPESEGLLLAFRLLHFADGFLKQFLDFVRFS